MNSLKVVLLSSLLITYSGLSSADTSYRYQGALQGMTAVKHDSGSSTPQEPEKPPVTPQWLTATPSYTEWTVSGAVGACTTWSPSLKTLAVGAAQQTSNDCSVQKSRVKQNREQETTTHEFRNAGDPITEIQTFNDGTSSRDLTIVSAGWITVGTPVCTAWTPLVTSIDVGTPFTQTAEDCSYTENYSVRYRIIGVAGPIKTELSDSRSVTNQTQTKSATGTKSVSIITDILVGQSTPPIPGFGTWIKGNGVFEFTPQPYYARLTYEIIGFNAGHDSSVTVGTPVISQDSCDGDTACTMKIDASMSVEGNPSVTNVWNGAGYLSNAYFRVKITKVP